MGFGAMIAAEANPRTGAAAQFRCVKAWPAAGPRRATGKVPRGQRPSLGCRCSRREGSDWLIQAVIPLSCSESDANGVSRGRQGCPEWCAITGRAQLPGSELRQHERLRAPAFLSCLPGSSETHRRCTIPRHGVHCLRGSEHGNNGKAHAGSFLSCRVGSSENHHGRRLAHWLVHCRVGSSENARPGESHGHQVHCRVGSEPGDGQGRRRPEFLSCLPGSSETTTTCWSRRTASSLPRRQLRKSLIEFAAFHIGSLPRRQLRKKNHTSDLGML